jgi:lysophospholipase L1-like esterase
MRRRHWPQLLAAVLTAACSGAPPSTSAPTETTAPHDDPPPPPAVTTSPVEVYVAIGGSDTVGVGAGDPASQAWPRVFARLALPPDAQVVNLGISGATVAEALDRQVPEALRRDADLVTVWLNVNDLLAGVPPAVYERRLGELVQALRAGGGPRVLIANTPPVDLLPAYVDCRARPGCLGGDLPEPSLVQFAVAAYNAAIARVAAAAGAEVVDLHAAGVAAHAEGRTRQLVGSDGFHPSTAGHRAVAEAFAAVLARR